MMRVASSYYHVIYNVDDVLFLLSLVLGFLGGQRRVMEGEPYFKAQIRAQTIMVLFI